MTAWSNPAEWTRSFTPHRIGDQILPTKLDQYRRVIDEGKPDPVAVNLLRRRFARRPVLWSTRGPLARASKLPPQNVEQSACLLGTWVEESLTVEVIGFSGVIAHGTGSRETG